MLARMRSIDLVVIHCSASPNGVWISPAQIDGWHREKGFKRDPGFANRFRPNLRHIGYHRLVLANGDFEVGRELDEVGAHVASHNPRSVGICMVGLSAFFAHQWETLRLQVCSLALGIADRRRHPVATSLYPVPSPAAAIELYGAMGVRVVGHRDLSPDIDGDGEVERHEWLKDCPNFDVARWLARGMEPEGLNVLDGHPAIAQASPVQRVMVGMRYGTP